MSLSQEGGILIFANELNRCNIKAVENKYSLFSRLILFFRIGKVMESKSCCFIGHRTVKDKEIIEKRLIEKVAALIKEDVDTFYFGSHSRFDDLAWEVVSELKKEYQYIKRIYVRSSYAYIDDSYKNYLLESYEDTYMPEGVENAGAASYVERNQAMINASDICVFYYDENYMPARRKQAKRALSDYQPKSGTKIAFEYATKKGKKIINVAKAENIND